MQFRIIPLPLSVLRTVSFGTPCMGEGALVDPGGEPERLLAQVQQLGVNLR